MGFVRVVIVVITVFSSLVNLSGGHDMVASIAQITSSSWDDATTGHTLVLYHADWCGHCKRLMPTFNKLAVDLESEGNKAHLASVLSTEHKFTPAASLVKGYPTLLWVHNQKVVARYNGDRSEASLKQFVEEHVQLSEEKLEAMKLKMAKEIEAEKNVASEAQMDKERKESELAAEFEAKVEELTDANFKERTAGIDSVVLVYADWCGHCKAMKPEWLKLASSLSKASVFRINGPKNSKFPGVELVEGMPTIFFIRNSELVAIYDGNKRTAAAFKKWISKVKAMSAAEVTEAIKSLKDSMQRKEEERKKAKAEQDALELAALQIFETQVTEVTAENFDDVTAEGTVALMLYAEWCGHCKAMKATWAEFAKMPTAQDIVVARMLENHLVGHPLQVFLEGYPTFLFLKHGHVVEKSVGRLSIDEITKITDAVKSLTDHEVEEKETALLQKLNMKKEEARRAQKEQLKAEMRQRDEEARRAKREKRKQRARQ